MVNSIWRIPKKVNPKRTTTRHTVIKMPKVKDREKLKSSKRKSHLRIKEFSIRLSDDFSKKTLQDRRN